jgi:plastocyanin
LTFPKILLAVPLLVAGMYVPALGSTVDKPSPGVIGMTHEGYSKGSVTIRPGQRLTFANNSRFIHIVGVGEGGHLEVPKNEPVNRRLLMQQNDVYTTGQWNTTGTYYLTCSVHPEMTIKVVVKK